MTRSYNGLNSIKTNLEAAGICKHDGLRLSDPKCTHATPAQIARTKKMDADYDFMQTYKDQARLCNRVIEDVSPRLNLFLEVCGDIDAQNGALLPIEVGGADVQDAVRWQDEGSKTINLNGYKATATASWRERHWNEGA
jgi:hypothetical protein